jgi:hypothetical protein
VKRSVAEAAAKQREEENTNYLTASVVHGCLLVARGNETFWDSSLFITTRSSLYYCLATPLLPVCVFQAGRFCAVFSRVNFLLHRRGQKATSVANRGGIPIAGQLEITLTYWRIGAPSSYTASLFANTGLGPAGSGSS